MAADLALSFRGHQPEWRPTTPASLPEAPSVGQGELTFSSSFTQLGGMWMRDLDLGSKVGPSGRAPWRGFGAASECQDRRRPDNAWRRWHHAPVV